MNNKLTRNNKLLKSRLRGFSLVEIMVALGIFTLVLAGVLNGSFALKNNIHRSQNLVKTRQKLANFIQAVHSFSNKSLGVYFLNSSAVEVGYIAEVDSYASDDDVWNSVFFQKNEDGSEVGEIVFDPDENTISWRKDNSTEKVIMENVYRPDYEDDTNKGVLPVFRFPHTTNLYTTNQRPNLWMAEFKVRLDKGENIPRMVPVKFMAQVNTVN